MALIYYYIITPAGFNRVISAHSHYTYADAIKRRQYASVYTVYTALQSESY